jgi:hypothetical protein
MLYEHMNDHSQSQYCGIVRILIAKKERLLLLGLVGLYAFSRLYNLRLLPIFLDETTHIQWSLNIWHAHGKEIFGALNEPLADGKLLHILLLSLVSPWAPDPLLGSRLISVLAGTVSLWSCYAIGKRLYGVQAGLFSAWLYIVCPFALFHDRMALADSLLCAGSVFTLWAAVALVQEPSWRHCLALSLSLALTPLVKATGVIVFLMPLLSCLLLAGPLTDPVRLRRRLPLVYVAAMACLGMIYVPDYLLGRQKPLAGILYLTALSGRLDVWKVLRAGWDHVLLAAPWVLTYFTLPIVVVGIVGSLLALIRVDRKALLLASVGVGLFGSILFLSDVMFPRYFLLTTGPWVVLTAATVVQLGQVTARRMKLGRIAFATVTAAYLVLVCIPAICFDYEVIMNIAAAPLPEMDRFQYIEGWPSGYGVEEAARFFEAEAERSPEGLMVICSEYGGNSYAGLRILLRRERKIRIDHLLARGEAEFARLERWAAERPVYVVFERPPLSWWAPKSQPDVTRLATIANRIRAYAKPAGKCTIDIYRVSLPSKVGSHVVRAQQQASGVP